MPQLRCAKTSELLAEGTPLEIATAAAGFPAGQVIFDDVPAGFDPAATVNFRQSEIDGLKAALAELPADAKETSVSLKSTIDEREARIDAGKKLVAPAKKARDAALQRVEDRKKRGRP